MWLPGMSFGAILADHPEETFPQKSPTALSTVTKVSYTCLSWATLTACFHASTTNTHCTIGVVLDCSIVLGCHKLEPTVTLHGLRWMLFLRTVPLPQDWDSRSQLDLGWTPDQTGQWHRYLELKLKLSLVSLIWILQRAYMSLRNCWVNLHHLPDAEGAANTCLLGPGGRDRRQV